MPQTSSASAPSTYLAALTQEIEKKLQKALDSQNQRFNLLQELFADIALEIDVRAQDEWWMNFGIDDLELQNLAIRILSQTCSSSGCEKNWSVFERMHTKRRNRLEHKRLNDLVYTHYNLRLKERQSSRKSLADPISLENIDLTDEWVMEAEAEDTPLLDVDDVEDWMDVADAILDEGADVADIILSRDGVGGASTDEIKSCLCFYDVLADHYVMMPENGKPVLDLIVQLWSQSFASHIFALLFHKWLFEVPVENTEGILRYASALFQGATNVFWVDIQTNKRRFFSLFRYLLEDVALVPLRLNKIPLQAQQELFRLLSRFLFFYDLVDKLERFLDHFPSYPNAFLIGGPTDFFVIELTDMLQKLKVEPVLLHYLSRMRALQGLELRMSTSTRMKSCLYSFTSPGGPMYPTRAVRHAAWEALDFLFPIGRYPRHLISLFFRLLYPWYWPSSCWNFIVSCIRAIFYSILRLLFSSWDSLTKKKHHDTE